MINPDSRAPLADPTLPIADVLPQRSGRHHLAPHRIPALTLLALAVFDLYRDIARGGREESA